ncbi:MAG: AAA family ATPase [Ilumatobacteraceae bacterium]
MTALTLPGYRDLQPAAGDGDLSTWIGADATGRRVVVRTHRTDLPTPAIRERLAEHADIVSDVSHPAMASLIELIDLPTRSALVVAHPEGSPLSEVLPTSLAVTDVLAIALDVVPALAELHVRGLGHGAVGVDAVWAAGATAMLTSPWYDGLRPLPSDDQPALARMVETLVRRSGAQMPEGVRAVLDVATDPDPGRRYRSIVGLAHDLARCRDQLLASGRCEQFPPAVDRFALDWRDPSLALGCGSSLEVLSAALRTVVVSGAPLVLVVEGPTGAGRSTVLREFGVHLAGHGVLHGAAQFAPGRDSEPLLAPRQVVAGVVERLLSGPPATRDHVARLLRDRVGSNGAVAVRLAPSLERMFGAQPDVPEGAVLDTVARVEASARAVITAFGEASPPFVALFDDAERADAASLAAFRGLLTMRSPVLVVLARRTDAVEVGLSELLDVLRGDGVTVRSWTVPPLERSAVREMIGAGLGLPDGIAAPLGDALWVRSGGNPGLAIADLHRLVADGDLAVDPPTAAWTWSARSLGELVPNGVATVHRERLERVAPSHLQVLCAAAVAGQVATPTVLALALDRSLETTSAVLDRLAADQLLEWRRSGVVQFHEDGIRRAAVDRLDGPTRGALRLRVARVVLAGGAGELIATEGVRFEVLQLLDGQEHALSEPEATLFVEWCDSAARTAHRSGGFEAALELQLRQLGMTGPMGWATDPDRMFDLHLRVAENALIVGRTSLVDQMLDQAWAHEPSAMQRVRALRLLGNRWWTRQDQSGGLAEMQAILRELGERFPTRPTISHVAREYAATRIALRGRTPQSFLEAPELTDERVRATLDTMLSAVHLAYTAEPLTHMLLVLRGMRLTARHGSCAASAYFVAGYGLLLCGLGRDLQRGIGFGRAGMALADRTGGAVRTMVCFAYNGFIHHWGEPLAATVEPLLDEYRRGLSAGRGGYAHTSGTFAALHSLLSSRPLPRVDELARGMTGDLQRLGEGAFAQRVKLVGQAVSDLRVGIEGRSPLNGELFSVGAWSSAKLRRGEFAMIVYTLRAFVALAHDRPEVAAEAVRAAAPNARTAPGEAIVGVHWFQTALLHRLGEDVDRGAARRAERGLRRAATANPHDYAHRIALIDALADGGSAQGLEAAAAIARQHDALADLCVIAHVAARRAADPGEAQRWRTMAVSALRAWGAEGVVSEGVAGYG